MTEPAPKRRRRWYQFSLRALMLFMVVCAVGFGWVGSMLEATRREQVVVAEIEALGGDVEYHDMVGPDWLARHFRKVSVVAFGGPFGKPLGNKGFGPFHASREKRWGWGGSACFGMFWCLGAHAARTRSWGPRHRAGIPDRILFDRSVDTGYAPESSGPTSTADLGKGPLVILNHQ